MKTQFVSDVVDLWEAWIDLHTGGNSMLYVLGTLSTGIGKMAPVLLKKTMQGAAPSHLILEVMPLLDTGGNRQVEVCYTEPVGNISQYRQISICDGENIIARIMDIEVVC